MTLHVEDFRAGDQCPLVSKHDEARRCEGVLELRGDVVEQSLFCSACDWEAEDLDDDNQM